MKRVVISILCLLVWPQLLLGQSNESSDFLGQMNRVVSSLRVIRAENANSASDLDLVSEQKQQIQALTEDYRETLRSYNLHIENDDQAAAIGLMASKLPVFQKRLHSEILLPHQSEYVEQKVFADLMRKAGGDIFNTISHNYAKVFGLSQVQTYKLRGISSRTQEQLAEAERQFKAQVARIRANARAEIEQTLSPEQLETLQRFSPRSPGN